MYWVKLTTETNHEIWINTDAIDSLEWVETEERTCIFMRDRRQFVRERPERIKQMFEQRYQEIEDL